jgi:hypothetical protein
MATLALIHSAQAQQAVYQGKVDAKQPRQTHKVQLEARQVYLLEMTSKDFDTYLFLNDSAGKPLAQNDDIEPGGNLNSRILYIPGKTGEYQLVATSFNKAGRGNYQITLRKLKPIGPVQGKEGHIDEKSPLFGDKKLKIPYQRNRFQLEAGVAYQIDLASKDFVPTVAIAKAGTTRILAGNTAENDNHKVRLLFLPNTAGAYDILASSFDKKSGSFQLTLQPLQPEGAAAPPPTGGKSVLQPTPR